MRWPATRILDGFARLLCCCVIKRWTGPAIALVAISCCHASCSRAHTENDPDAAWLVDRGASRLAKVFHSMDLQVVRKGGNLSVVDRQIDLHARVENRGQQGGQHFLAAAFGITIDGAPVPAFLTGVVEVDQTAEGAWAKTATAWSVRYAAPIGYAVARWLGADGAPRVRDGLSTPYHRVDVDDEAFYLGPVAIRGDATGGSTMASEAFVRNIATRVLPLLGDRHRFGSATIKVGPQGATEKDGECLVNGSVSTQLLAALRKIEWPGSDAERLYMLFLVSAPVIRK